MNKYEETDRRLATLLKIEGDLSHGTLWEIGKAWCHDDAAAFRLMVEHCYLIQIYVTVLDPQVRVNMHIEQIADHPDTPTAVRYAIVQAVIAKLEGEKS